MLTAIQIDNFAIIDHLDIDFQPGMTVLTGETGAGKSIVVDALALLLGVRADASVVREGAKRADISARFDLKHLAAVRDWLNDQELDDPDPNSADNNDCLLRRVISREGRSKGFINGHPATLSMMKALGEQLVDIHGQHAHQALLRPGMQSRLLDNFGKHEKQRQQVGDQWRVWKKLEQELSGLQLSEKQRHDRHELLDYQVTELDEFGISAEEILTIDDHYNRLANSQRLLEETDAQFHALYQKEQLSAFEIVSQAASKLEELSKLDKNLSSIGELLQSACIQIQEAAQELRHYHDQIDQDPEKMQQLDQRLSMLHELARKHRIDVKSLPELHIQLHEELSQLNHSNERLSSLEEDVEHAKEQFLNSAEALNKARHKSAHKLNKAISHYLSQLGMTGGKFVVDFETLEEQRYGKEGTEKIRFLVSANPGQPVQPIAKVASGGELSRISLAIQVVTVTNSSIPCLIFDEVDVGIGGGTAEVVGNLLNSIANNAQVICVTHQAQVASKGDHHYRVVKSSSDNRTNTIIETLHKNERKEEIARMIGGIHITEQTRKYAEEMLAG